MSDKTHSLAFLPVRLLFQMASVKKQKIIQKKLKPLLAIQTLRMYSNEVKGAPQNPDLLRSYMVGRVLLRPSSPTIQHIYTYQIKKSVQPTGYDAFIYDFHVLLLIVLVHRSQVARNSIAFIPYSY